jgi:hypothetical protein
MCTSDLLDKTWLHHFGLVQEPWMINGIEQTSRYPYQQIGRLVLEDFNSSDLIICLGDIGVN